MRAQPPTMRQLMDDPVYRAYVKRMPPQHPANDMPGDPWQVWVNRGNGRWGTVLKSTYADAWAVFVHHYRASAEDHRDVSLVARRVFYAPPGEWYKVKVKRPRRPTPTDPNTSHVVIETRWRRTFVWDREDMFQWCGRCRRPTLWQILPETHHAIRRLPVVTTDGDRRRCNICGIRAVALPHVDQMTRPAMT